MSGLEIGQVSGSGMQFERSRLDLATLKLSLANMSFSSRAAAEQFIEQLQGTESALAVSDQPSDSSLMISKYSEPSNAAADADGYVYKFAIDPTHEMATLISATRAYEANVRAYNALTQMNKAAMDMGNY